jgi:hypothetical protein
VQALELKLKHRTEPVTRVRLGLASVTGDPARLADVSMQKLSRLELAAPILSLELLSGRLQPLSADSLDVFARLGGGNRDTAPQLVERLRARLGEQAVYRICPVPEHRPEAAWQRVHAFQADDAPRTGRRVRAPHAQEMPRLRCSSPMQTSSSCNEAVPCSRKVPSASRAAGGTARMSRAITTSCAKRAVLGCGFFRNGDPSAGMCTVCSLEALWCTPSCMP